VEVEKDCRGGFNHVVGGWEEFGNFVIQYNLWLLVYVCVGLTEI